MISDGERDRLQVEHQLDVLLEIVGHAGGRLGSSRSSPLVLRASIRLDAPLDLAHVVEVVVQPRAVGRAELCRTPSDLVGDPVEDAAIGAAVRGALFRRGADAEQLIERRARIADHRQRLGRVAQLIVSV